MVGVLVSVLVTLGVTQVDSPVALLRELPSASLLNASEFCLPQSVVLLTVLLSFEHVTIYDHLFSLLCETCMASYGPDPGCPSSLVRRSSLLPTHMPTQRASYLPPGSCASPLPRLSSCHFQHLKHCSPHCSRRPHPRCPSDEGRCHLVFRPPPLFPPR